MAYNFKVLDIRRLLNVIFNTSSGHDHDGVNSKAVSVGTVADGAITAAKLASDAVITAKILDANVTAGKLASNSVTTAKILDGNVTIAKLSTTAKTKVLSYQVEDLAANADIADRVIFYAPSGIDVTLVSASIIAQGSAAGIDDSNTCVITLSDGAQTIVTKTYDSDPAFPAAATVTSLGSLDATYKVLSAGEKLYLSITNGTTANPPAFMLEVVYTIADAA
jgi:hypothetical protein